MLPNILKSKEEKEAANEFDTAMLEKYKLRKEQIERIFPKDQFNYVNLGQSLMSQLPPDARFYPQLIEAEPNDFWHDGNSSIGLKPGEQEPSAKLLARLGHAAGVRLKKTSEGVVEDKIGDKTVEFYKIEYSPELTLPNGDIVKLDPIGKRSEYRTKSGSIQAHIAESVDVKARRNAIKAILSIPTVFKSGEDKKPFVVMKVSATNQGAIDSASEKDVTAKTKLYAQNDAKDVWEKVKVAENISSLDSIVADANETVKDEFLLDAIRMAYSRRKKELSAS